MTFVNDIQKADGGLFERISTNFSAYRATRRERIAQNRVYAQTLRELRSLSNRDLADIGISQYSIEAIAHEAAYGK